MSRSFPTLWIAASLLCACKAAPPPTHQTVGGFGVSWVASPPSLAVMSSDGRVLVASQGALIESRTVQATWQEMFGAFLVSEPDAGWNEPTSLAVQSSSADGVTLSVTQSGGHSSTISITSPTFGVLALAFATDGQNRVRAGFTCQADDHFLGFGAQTDALDHRGHKIPIWTSEPGIGKTDYDDPDPSGLWFLEGTRHQASYPLPTFLSNRGFDFLADDTHRQIFDLCQADPARWTVETWDSAVTYKLFDGPQPAWAIERLTADTGRQPLANDLVLAPWNDAIFGSANVRMIASELRADHIPSGAIWTEDYRGGSWNGTSYAISENWGVDRTLYPDIEQLAADLHAEGFRFLAYHSSFLHQGTDVLPLAEDAGVEILDANGKEYDFEGDTFEPTSMVDLSSPAGAAFIEGWFKTIAGYGFDGWMADFGEWLPVDAKLAGGQDAESFHNQYPAAYHAVSAQAFSDLGMPANTSLYFARSGGLRDAPNQPVVWGGDQLVSFDNNDGFPSALMRGLNLGLAGIALYGSDIAGYQNFEGPPSTKELFFRWTTMGALSTVMRTHHGTLAQLNWRFDTDAETTAHFARWSQFHAQLWPYLRSAAQQAFLRGQPIMQALAFAYPQDPAVWTIPDEYLFGSSLLVAPVLIQGETSRVVYLPSDLWLPMWSGLPQLGPWIGSVDLPITEIGLYARAGSIIPMLPATLDTLMPADPTGGLVTLDAVRTQRVLRVFAGADGSWIDLDGTTYSLVSSTNDPPTAVQVNGGPVGSCAGGALPCADIDSTDRLVTAQAAGVTRLELEAASRSSVLTVAGPTTVEQVFFRY